MLTSNRKNSHSRSNMKKPKIKKQVFVWEYLSGENADKLAMAILHTMEKRGKVIITIE